MQDRYVGDIGDFFKLAILRALLPGRQLGMLWWHFPDEVHNADGRHVAYLSDPGKWRSVDPDLFDTLRDIVERNDRRVDALTSTDLLPGAIHALDPVPTQGPFGSRKTARAEWFAATRQAVENCDLLFLDPDNGLETAGFSSGSAKAGKSVSLHELAQLQKPERTIVVYHHQTRRAGGHLEEIGHWRERLLAIGFKTVDALRAAAFSPRAFFILNASPAMKQVSENLCLRWPKRALTWHPDPSPTSLPSQIL